LVFQPRSNVYEYSPVGLAGEPNLGAWRAIEAGWVSSFADVSFGCMVLGGLRHTAVERGGPEGCGILAALANHRTTIHRLLDSCQAYSASVKMSTSDWPSAGSQILSLQLNHTRATGIRASQSQQPLGGTMLIRCRSDRAKDERFIPCFAACPGSNMPSLCAQTAHIPVNTYK